METNKILDADILDIVFEGRNKEYGAYQLRKTYNRRLMYSLSAMLGLALLAVAGTVLGKNREVKKPLLHVDAEVTLSAVKEDRVIPPPVIPPKAKKVPDVEIKKFTPPVITEHEVKEPPPAQIELDKTTIGTFNQKGTQTDIVQPLVEEKSLGAVAPLKTEDEFTEVKSVQIQARFPGGPDAWMKFLSRNLEVSIPADNGAPAGDYKVMVSFLVDRNGNVTGVKAENDPGFGIAAEAVRVIQKSGKWLPAVQNGRNVIYRQMQQIIFRVYESE